MEGKKVLITGGADGIGFGLTQALLQSNAQVCILDVNKSKGEAREQELHKKYDENQSKFIYCDVTDLDMFSNAVEEAIHFLGHIDIFINNAGIADERNFQKCISVNLTAAIHGTNLAMQHMDKQNGGNGGQIVNVSSMAEFVLESSVPVYCATKSGILHYTRALSLLPNLDSMGISFQNICPSCTDTAIITDRGEKVPRFEDFLKNMEKNGVMPIERVVGAFMKLLTDNINGGVMIVTGRDISYVDYK